MWRVCTLWRARACGVRSRSTQIDLALVTGAGHVYVKIRGGELGDKNAKKGDASSEALIKDGFGRGNKMTDIFRGRADRSA